MGIQTVVQCGGFQRQDDGENVRCVVENMRAGCVCDVNDTTSWPGLYSHFHEMQIANITCSLTHSLALAHILLSFRLYCRKRGLVLCSNVRRCVVESSTVQQFLSLALAASSYLLSMYCYASTSLRKLYNKLQLSKIFYVSTPGLSNLPRWQRTYYPDFLKSFGTSKA